MTSAALRQSTSPALELSAFQNRVLAIPERFDIALGGGRGGSKSFTLAILFMRHAEQFGNRARMLFVRQSFPGIVDFEATTRELFGSIYGRAASYNAASHLWRFPNNATLQLDQMENEHDFPKFQGKSYSIIGVDEAQHYPDPAPIDLLRSCLRGPAEIPTRFMLAGNPGGRGHNWLAERHMRARPWEPYLETKTKRQWVTAPSVFLDNPFINRAEYADQLTAATALDPELGRAWRDGDWSVVRGAYFAAVLDEQRVMIEDPDPAEVERPYAHYRDGWRLSLAYDHGFTAPAVCFVVGESPGLFGPGDRFFPRDSIALFAEMATNQPGSLERGMQYLVPRLADEIKALAKRWGIRPVGVADDSIFARGGSSAGAIAEEFRRCGVYWSPARKGDRVAGWERMRRLLADAGKPDRAGLFVARSCSYWWQTVPVLGRDARKPDDVDSRAPDHAADACRYGIVGRVRPPVGVTSRYRTLR
jgi:hypothetical protein